MTRNRSDILSHYEKTISWARTLSSIAEEKWRCPIAKSKWTVAEVVGHFNSWDEFVAQQRLPYFFTGNPLPKAPDTKEINLRSARVSRQQPKERVIQAFIRGRRELIEAIHSIEAELWAQEFYIGENKHTLSSYFASQIEHDWHHFHQIERIIGCRRGER